MSDFKPGDEVVAVGLSPDNDPHFAERRGLYGGKSDVIIGQTYTVDRVVTSARDVGLVLKGKRSRHRTGAYCALGFRKVERRTDKRSLTEWLSQPSGDTDALDKPRPVKKRERAQ